MASNHEDLFPFNGILDDISASIINELPDIDQVSDLLNVDSALQQIDFMFSDTEEMPQGTPQSNPPQFDGEILPAQIVDSDNGQVILDVNLEGLELKEENDLPEDFGILNTEGSVTSRDLEYPNATERPVNVNEDEVANAHGTDSHEGHAKNGDGRTDVLKTAKLPNSPPTQVDITAPTRSCEHMAFTTHSKQNMAAEAFHTPMQQQHNAASMPTNMLTQAVGNVIPLSASLDNLPGLMRDSLLFHARRQSFAGAGIRMLQTAQKAAIKTHRIGHNREIPQTPSNAHSTLCNGPMQQAQLGSICTPPVRRKRSRSSSNNNSPRKRARQIPRPQITPVRHRLQTVATSNIVSSSMPATYVKRMPSIEVPRSCAWLDFHSTPTEVPRHPLMPIPPSFLKLNHPMQALEPETPYNCIASRTGTAHVQATTAEIIQEEKVAQSVRAPSERFRAQVSVATSKSLAIPTYVPQHPKAAVPTRSQLVQLSQSHNGPKLRFSKNAAPSTYCHICGRSSTKATVFECANVPIGLCRKVFCERCIIIHEPSTLEWARQDGGGWLCVHCRGGCPEKARCFQYKRNNQKRREKNEEKKRQRRQQMEQQQNQEKLAQTEQLEQLEQPEVQNKRRRHNDPGEDPGVSPTGVYGGAF